MLRHRSNAAQSAADEPIRKDAPEASPLPAVWPGQTRRHIVLWDEFPEEVAGLRAATRRRLWAVGKSRT